MIKLGILKNIKITIDYNVFSGPGGISESNRLDVPLLGKIPLNPDLSLSVDCGTPFVLKHSNSNVSKKFQEIAEQIKKKLK